MTTETVRQALARGSVQDARLGGAVELAALERRFFHWPLAFPEVFAGGGFDLVLGNPPFLWPLEKAEEYPDLIRIVREKVKPERDRLKRQRRRERWWIFAENAPGLYSTIGPLSRVLARSRISETHALVLLPKDWVYNEQTVVFAFDDCHHFALLQSSIHEAWVRRNASTMRTDLRYTPTDCFETFPFPQSPPPEARAEAARLGESYHEHRRQTMLARQLGLTKTYNLFHNPECADADIARLRELHAAMDRAILACYGWSDLDPGNGFHVNERGQTRCTIGPEARREVLRRLLALNLEVAAREAADTAHRATVGAPHSG